MEEKKLAKGLTDIVGDRVTTSEFERWFYTSYIRELRGQQ